MSTRRGRTPDPDQAAARLVERVLSDSAFRAHFRRDPAKAAREAGLDPVDEPTADRALETLELRESKSSLAGALMAAAVEGVALYDVLDQDVSVRHAVTRALSGIGVADAQAAAPAASPDALALVRNEQRPARLGRRGRPPGGTDRRPHRRGARRGGQAPRDHGLRDEVRSCGPDSRRVRLQPPLRACRRHRGCRRQPGVPRQRCRPRGRGGAAEVGSPHPPYRARLPLGAFRSVGVHGWRPSGPPPRRLRRPHRAGPSAAGSRTD